MKPEEYSATSLRRRSVLVGAARKTVSRPWRRSWATGSAASSTLRSVEDAVDAAAGGLFAEAVEAVAEQRVHVTEQEDGDLASLEDAAGDLEDAGDGGAGVEGAVGSALDDGSVGDGVGEGDAEFEDIGAAAFEGEGEFGGGFGAGVAGGEIGDESGPALELALGEAAFDTGTTFHRGYPIPGGFRGRCRCLCRRGRRG